MKLGIDGLSVTGEDSANADAAVNIIADAVAKVSVQCSALGAIRNRLELEHRGLYAPFWSRRYK